MIEGASDMVICRSLINKLELNVDVAGSQIIPIDGKGQFPIITKFFRLINKEVAILTDLDGFIDDNNIVDLFVNLPKAVNLANERGIESVSEIVRGIKSKITDLVKEHMDDMKTIYEQHPYWINKSEEDDELQIAKRAFVGQLFSTDNIESWIQAQEWKSIKCRLESLFCLLADVGCFILKKGALESYYQFAPNTAYSDKPSVAAEEAAYIYEQNTEFILEKYNDVVVPLKYISITKAVDESLAVRKELLSELALIMEVLDEQGDEKEIYSIIKRAKGSASLLFEYKVIRGEKLGVEVNIKSKIIDISGFPFIIFSGQNVNEVVKEKVKITSLNN